ncbi:MAG TPA: GNAT family N-acetyltransferase [Miltoncostaea sp.]|nr:GNAT family N-acetyltransferase [Miltoncostaea sp.]
MLGEVGAGGVLVLAVQRALPRRLVHIEWFVVQELLAAVARPMPSDGDIRWATPDDDALLASIGGDVAVSRGRRLAGDAAAVCIRDGRLAGHVYLRSGRYDEQGMIVRIRDDERWIYDGVVAPDMRGAGIYPRLVRTVSEDLAARGVVRLLSAIDRLNIPSLRSARRRGGMAIGTVLMVRVLGVSIRREDWFGRVRWRVHRGPRDLHTPSVEVARRRPLPTGRPA